MEQILTKNASATAVAGMTLIEEFMSESYDFRHNVLADKYEVSEKGTAAWRPNARSGHPRVVVTLSKVSRWVSLGRG